MTHFLDTDTTATVSPQDLSLCSVVKAELPYGGAKSNIAERTLGRLNVFFLEKRATPIGPNGLMIAAIALANGLTLVTHNQREFGRITTLKLEDWE